MTATLHDAGMQTADSFFQPLMDYVISATGLTYYTDRRREFANHVARRLEELRIDSCLPYLQFLKSEPSGMQEMDSLVTLLTIGETHFFRHRELFQALQSTVFPRLLEKNKRQRRLRIWSAGCSTGAEAYSVSMLLRHRFASCLSDWDVRIIGTDINRKFLARAVTGRFDAWALRAVSEEERKTCFLREGKTWVVKPAFQKGVSFAYHNLATPQFASPLGHRADFDLILCRNVMIYFSQDVVRQSIGSMHTCLAPDGWLVVGHAEHNINWFGSFHTHMADGAVLYQKKDTPDMAHEAPFAPRGAVRPIVQCEPVQREKRMAMAIEPGRDRVNLSPTYTCESSPEAEHNQRNPLLEIRELADRGELAEALRRCRALQRSSARDPSPHFYQALIFQQTNDDAGAEQSLKRAIYLDRNHLLAHYYLGLLLQKQNIASRAIRCFRNVIELLAERPPSEQISDADGLTVADLHGLSRAHLNVLEKK